MLSNKENYIFVMLKYSNNKYTTVIILSDSKKIELRVLFAHNTFQKPSDGSDVNVGLFHGSESGHVLTVAKLVFDKLM